MFSWCCTLRNPFDLSVFPVNRVAFNEKFQFAFRATGNKREIGREDEGRRTKQARRQQQALPS